VLGIVKFTFYVVYEWGCFFQFRRHDRDSTFAFVRRRDFRLTVAHIVFERSGISVGKFPCLCALLVICFFLWVQKNRLCPARCFGKSSPRGSLCGGFLALVLFTGRETYHSFPPQLSEYKELTELSPKSGGQEIIRYDRHNGIFCFKITPHTAAIPLRRIYLIFFYREVSAFLNTCSSEPIGFIKIANRLRQEGKVGGMSYFRFAVSGPS
jgi:hypothetical protein